jgi:hypothetical protein
VGWHRSCLILALLLQVLDASAADHVGGCKQIIPPGSVCLHHDLLSPTIVSSTNEGGFPQAWLPKANSIAALDWTHPLN